MKNIYKYLLLLTLVVTFTGCNDFLEEPPSKSAAVVPETLEDFESLLNNYSSFFEETSLHLIFSTDDYELSTTIHDQFKRAYPTIVPIFGNWDMELAATQPSFFTGWPAEWKKIFTANLILSEIDGASGATDPEKANIKAECHFIRAYSYFLLATQHCLPFTETTKSELGLPIKATTSFEENIARANLEDTYAFIEADLLEALKITREFQQVNDLNSSWRASSAAVNGFAARFYLALNDYEMAQSFAQDALDEYDVLRNYNTDMRFSSIPEFATIFDPGPTQVEIFYPYTHDQRSDTPQDRLEFGEFYYYRMLINPVWNYYPSQELLGLFDQTNDLRYKFHMVEDYTYTRGAIDPPFSYPGYIFFYKSDIPSGPSVPEMLLIKAECQIRQGMWSEGIQTANILRAARMDASAATTDINLSAVSQDDALIKVLEERRREMPFVHRWYDIKRYNNNETNLDDVILTKTFYPFNASVILDTEAPITTTLDKNDRRFAFPIPEDEILISDGVLEQNQY